MKLSDLLLFSFSKPTEEAAHQIIDEYINENIYSEIKTVTIYVKIIALSMFSVSAI
jgi:hypothetical protein